MKLGLILILGLLIGACTPIQEEVNYCEEFANAKHVSISYPEKIYSFNNITISEEELKRHCSTS